MGRVVANEDFLRALFLYDPYDQYHFYLENQSQIDSLKQRLEAEFPGLDIRFGLKRDLPWVLGTTRFEVFHLSDWVTGYVPLAMLRNCFAGHIFPITGPIHSISYARYHAEFLKHLWPGCTGRDAIIVTSKAGRAVVEKSFEELRCNYRLPENFAQPALKHIPLGVTAPPSEHEVGRLRAEGRKALELAETEVMLLYLGRISHGSKKDMLPLLRTLKRIEESGTDLARVRLVLAGWVDDDDCAVARLKGFAGALGINLTVVLRPDNEERSRLYASADIFVSLVDNLQETFGITLLEAGAFGLPVVASDFDGYRDLVVHGETGYLVPSFGPRQTDICDTLAHFWPDAPFHLLVAQETAVYLPKAAKYIGRLINDAGLRKKMGDSARRRVESSFTWDKIIPQYVAVWKELARAELPDGLCGKTHPARLSYSNIFSAHFSSLLDAKWRVVWTKSGEALYRGKEKAVIYEGIEGLLPVDLLEKVMFWARSPTSVAELSGKLVSEGLKAESADYLLLWALKHDFLELAEEPPPPEGEF